MTKLIVSKKHDLVVCIRGSVNSSEQRDRKSRVLQKPRPFATAKFWKLNLIREFPDALKQIFRRSLLLITEWILSLILPTQIAREIRRVSKKYVDRRTIHLKFLPLKFYPVCSRGRQILQKRKFSIFPAWARISLSLRSRTRGVNLAVVHRYESRGINDG